MKHNFHTHTSRCQHAVGTDEAYVEAALDAGFDVLGFADHAPFPFANGFVSGIRMPLDQLADYIHSVHALQQRYAGQLEIRLGLESEYFPRYHDHLLRMREQGIGYYILGQHYADSEEDNPYIGFECQTDEGVLRYAQSAVAAMRTGCSATSPTRICSCATARTTSSITRARKRRTCSASAQRNSTCPSSTICWG